jgi:hypothetical protein
MECGMETIPLFSSCALHHPRLYYLLLEWKRLYLKYNINLLSHWCNQSQDLMEYNIVARRTLCVSCCVPAGKSISQLEINKPQTFYMESKHRTPHNSALDWVPNFLLVVSFMLRYCEFEWRCLGTLHSSGENDTAREKHNKPWFNTNIYLWPRSHPPLSRQLKYCSI